MFPINLLQFGNSLIRFNAHKNLNFYALSSVERMTGEMTFRNTR